MTNETKKRKIFTGSVVSTKMSQTIVVSVERRHKDPMYKKALRRSSRFLVHAPGHTVHEGDKVTIEEIRPISKLKHFTLIGVVDQKKA